MSPREAGLILGRSEGWPSTTSLIQLRRTLAPLCPTASIGKDDSWSPIPESSIGFSDTWRVRRAAPGTRSSRARHRRPAAIPCHEFQRRPLEHSANLAPKLWTLHVCPSGAPNVARIRWGERIFQKRGSLNLLSGPQNRVSLPNKFVTSAGLSRLSVAFEIECPIVREGPKSARQMISGLCALLDRRRSCP